MIKAQAGISPYEQKWGDFDVKFAKFPLFKVILRKFHRKRWETAQTTGERSEPQIFCHCASISLLKNRFPSVFLWFSDFFQEFRGGGGHVAPPPVSAPGWCQKNLWGTSPRWRHKEIEVRLARFRFRRPCLLRLRDWSGIPFACSWSELGSRCGSRIRSWGTEGGPLHQNNLPQ